VGIEHVHSGALRRTLLRSSGKNRITEDSESSARWALSRCVDAQEDRTTGRSGRRPSARRAVRHCADRHRRKRTL
jgi:hypothetical protein